MCVYVCMRGRTCVHMYARPCTQAHVRACAVALLEVCPPGRQSWTPHSPMGGGGGGGVVGQGGCQPFSVEYIPWNAQDAPVHVFGPLWWLYPRAACPPPPLKEATTRLPK